MLRFESFLRVYNAINPVTTFCQVFKVEIGEVKTVFSDLIWYKKASASNETEALFLCVCIANTVIVCYQSLSSSTYSVCSRKNFFSSGLRSRPIVPPGFIR